MFLSQYHIESILLFSLGELKTNGVYFHKHPAICMVLLIKLFHKFQMLPKVPHVNKRGNKSG